MIYSQNFIGQYHLFTEKELTKIAYIYPYREGSSINVFLLLYNSLFKGQFDYKVKFLTKNI